MTWHKVFANPVSKEQRQKRRLRHAKQQEAMDKTWGGMSQAQISAELFPGLRPPGWKSLLQKNPSLIWTQRDTSFGPSYYSNVVEYSLRDYKGRSIGGYAVITDGYPGPGIFLRTQATRDGEAYGAITSRTKCASLEQAKSLAEKKLAEAAKRYAKQFGGP